MVATIFELALAAVDLAQKLAARAAQSGELTDEQRASLRQKAMDIFMAFSVAPPPPPGV